MTSFELEALFLSLRIAGVALIVLMPLAIGLGWLLSRPRLPARWLLETLVNLPLVLPPVVTGLVLLLLFGASGPIGGWLEATFGVRLAFHWTGAALAAGIMALPLAVRPIRQAFEAQDRGLDQVAASLGAPPVSRFLRIALPLAAPGVVAGGVLGFARAFGEFGATVTFAGAVAGETQTVPVAIYLALQGSQGDGPAIRLALLSVAVSIVALAASEWMLRRGRGGVDRD